MVYYQCTEQSRRGGAYRPSLGSELRKSRIPDLALLTRDSCMAGLQSTEYMLCGMEDNDADADDDADDMS